MPLEYQFNIQVFSTAFQERRAALNSSIEILIIEMLNGTIFRFFKRAVVFSGAAFFTRGGGPPPKPPHGEH